MPSRLLPICHGCLFAYDESMFTARPRSKGSRLFILGFAFVAVACASFYSLYRRIEVRIDGQLIKSTVQTIAHNRRNNSLIMVGPDHQTYTEPGILFVLVHDVLPGNKFDSYCTATDCRLAHVSYLFHDLTSCLIALLVGVTFIGILRDTPLNRKSGFTFLVVTLTCAMLFSAGAAIYTFYAVPW